MRLQRINSGLTGTTAAAALALLLTACGPSQPAGQSGTEPAASSSSASTSPAAAETSAPPSSSSAAAPSAPPSKPTAASAPSSPRSTGTGSQLCKASALKASTDSTGGGAAGSVYMQLILTNSGTASCHLKGFAGVSLTSGPNGKPIGAPAQRDTSAPVTDVLLAPGQSGSAVLRYTQAHNYPDCVRTSAAGFRIYPPEDTASLFVARPSDACSNASIELLTVGAFQVR